MNIQKIMEEKYATEFSKNDTVNISKNDLQLSISLLWKEHYHEPCVWGFINKVIFLMWISQQSIDKEDSMLIPIEIICDGTEKYDHFYTDDNIDLYWKKCKIKQYLKILDLTLDNLAVQWSIQLD